MTIRETVYSILTTDDVLISEGIEVWNIEAVDNPDRQKPFLVTAWGDRPRTAWGASHRHDLLVWAHDEGGDYTRIDRLLDRVKDLLEGITHQGGISQVDWQGASPDLYDDGFHTITRNHGFRVIGTG